jgi:virginiamycin B lyase
VQAPGSLAQVSCGSAEHIVGVNFFSGIYKYVPSRNDWTKLPGSLTWVSAGADGAIWGVNALQAIYRWNGGGWDEIPGRAVQGELFVLAL